MRVGIIYDKGEKCKTEHEVLSAEEIKNDVNSVKRALRSLGHEAVIIPLQSSGSDHKYSIGRFFSRRM